MYGNKIRMIRELRNLSQEFVSDKLGIKQNSYSRIENNQTKLTTEMLQKIAEVLEVSPIDIMNNQPAVINFTNTQQGFGYIQNFISDQKELYQQVIDAKDEEIRTLKEIILDYKKMVESLSK